MIEVFDENKPNYLQIMDLIKKQMISKVLLTERELVGLRLIARNLVITPSSVKTHTRNISSKLEVSNHTQAAARAHGLGLLQTSPFGLRTGFTGPNPPLYPPTLHPEIPPLVDAPPAATGYPVVTTTINKEIFS